MGQSSRWFESVAARQPTVMPSGCNAPFRQFLPKWMKEELSDGQIINMPFIQRQTLADYSWIEWSCTFERGDLSTDKHGSWLRNAPIPWVLKMKQASCHQSSNDSSGPFPIFTETVPAKAGPPTLWMAHYPMGANCWPKREPAYVGFCSTKLLKAEC